jgi:hypothetical protein
MAVSTTTHLVIVLLVMSASFVDLFAGTDPAKPADPSPGSLDH